MSLWSNLTVTKIDNIITVPSNRGRHIRIQDRKCYGLGFCYEGQITYTINSTRISSNRDVAVLLPYGGSYELLGESNGRFPLINFHCLNGPPSDRIEVCRLSASEGYLHEYERLLSRWTFGAEHAELMTILYGILARLSLEERHEPPLLAPVMEYIGQHFTSTTLSNTELARQANLSEVYFRRLFKQTYNTTPHRHVLDLRIRLAKQLLSEGITSVTAISETCGFASVYHFCRAFKTETGLSPSEYAKKA